MAQPPPTSFAEVLARIRASGEYQSLEARLSAPRWSAEDVGGVFVDAAAQTVFFVAETDPKGRATIAQIDAAGMVGVFDGRERSASHLRIEDLDAQIPFDVATPSGE